MNRFYNFLNNNKIEKNIKRNGHIKTSEMPDYQQGQIYKLWCPDNELVYIGSTCNALRKRLNHHKSKLKCRSKLLFESGCEVKIELIEKYPCNDKVELNKREGELIRATDCVNKCIAGRSKKEYNQDHKEYYKEYRKEYNQQYRQEHKEEIKEYYQNHKEKIKQYQQDNKEQIKEKYSKPYQCVCGVVIRFGDKARHFKTIKHLNYVS